MLLVLLLGSRAVAAEATPRPNILWVVSEDNTFDLVGAYGRDPLARTPNIDRLAKDGIVFDHVYTQPVCAPSRSTIITGRYAASLGTQDMRSANPLPAGVKFFPQFLRAAGYYCTNNGKTDYNTSYTGDSTPYDTQSPLRFQAGSVAGHYPAVWNENSNRATWRTRKPGQPFFAVFNFFESHESRLQRRVPLETDPTRVRVPAYLPDTPVVRADLAQYHDCVHRADIAIGKILAELKADGLAEDTIIFYYSDNGGVLTGPKRSLSDQGTHVAMVAYFPPKYAHLAPSAPGTHCKELITFADLAPTMMSLAGLRPADQFQGRAFAGEFRRQAPDFAFTSADRMDERYNLVRAVTDGKYRYIRNYYPDRPWGQHLDYQWQIATIREWRLYYEGKSLNAAQRHFFEPAPAEMLFDCEVDPDNVRNLAAEPAMAQCVARMRAALNRQMLAIHDTGFLPEPMMLTQAAGRSPTAITGDPQSYPLEQILNLLDSAQLGTEATARPLERAASADPRAVLRYWAMMEAHRTNCADIVTPGLRDVDAVVRVAAAEQKLISGIDHRALEVISDAASQGEDTVLRLFALDALARLPRGIPASLNDLLGRWATGPDTGGYQHYINRISLYILNEENDLKAEPRWSPYVHIGAEPHP